MINNDANGNPFLNIKEPKAWGPGSFEMAKSLVESTNIKEGMRVLEVGGGSGQIATTLAKFWNVSVVTLEPWSDGTEIQSYAKQQNVENQVLALKIEAQSMPFASGTFDAVISIGSFEMIGKDRPVALSEMIELRRVAPESVLQNLCVCQVLYPLIFLIPKQSAAFKNASPH